MKKVALFLANGFEEMEALGTVDILRRANIDVTTVSISETSRVVGAHNIPVEADALFDACNTMDFDAYILPGGMPGAKHLKEHAALGKLIKEASAAGKTVAAICAAPMVLGSLGLLEGKNATCYPGFENELIGAKAKTDNVVVDGNIITGKGPGLVFDFGLQIVEHLVGVGTRKEVAEGLLL